MIFTSRNYAIGRAHFQIAGGLRMLLLLAAGYLAVAISLFALFFYNAGWPIRPRVLDGLYTLVLVVEAILLAIFGSIRVAGCIRTDVQTNMIESHRLMPIQAWRAVLGYLLGTTIHVMVITAINIAALAVLAAMSHQPVDNVIINQFVLAMFALFVWCFSAMGALMFRQMMPLIVLGFVFGGCTSMALRSYAVLPALSMLASPFLGETIFNLTGGGVSIRSAYPVAISAQLAFSVLFFIGACRRYRGTYTTTFNVPMGLALLLIWSALSIVAIANWSAFTGRFLRDFEQPATSVQVVASLTAAALLAIVPLYGLSAWQRRRPVPPILVIGSLLAAALLAVVIILAAPFNAWLWSITSTVLILHVLTTYATLRALRRAKPPSILIAMAGLYFILWVLPILAELVRWMFLPPPAVGHYEFGILGTLSPLGLLISQWTGDEPPTAAAGLCIQSALLVALWIAGNTLARRPTAPPPHSAGSPAAITAAAPGSASS